MQLVISVELIALRAIEIVEASFDNYSGKSFL